MTEDLDSIKAGLEQATPRPDPARRAAHLALAQKNYARLHKPQGTLSTAQPLWVLPKRILQSMTTRGCLTVCSALIATGFLTLTPQLQSVLRPSPNPQITSADFDGTVTEPRIESGPLEIDDMRSEMLQQEPLVDMQADILQEPFITPDTERTTPPANRAIDITNQRIRTSLGPNSAVDETIAIPELLPFSAETDAYVTVRRAIDRGQIPPPADINIAGMVNEFPLDTRSPVAGADAIQPIVTTFQTPWNLDTQLVHIALQSAAPVASDRSPLNLILLLDASAFARDATTALLLREGVEEMLGAMRPEDKITIVSHHASGIQILSSPEDSNDVTTVFEMLAELGADTEAIAHNNLWSALTEAEVIDDEGVAITHLIVATDRNFTSQSSEIRRIQAFTTDKPTSGASLSIIGFGQGDEQDRPVESGIGVQPAQISYVETAAEARRALAEALLPAQETVAQNVEFRIGFDAVHVAEYRIIGGNPGSQNQATPTHDQLDLGMLSAGDQRTIMYEVTPVSEGIVRASEEALGQVIIQYNAPGEIGARQIETPIGPAGRPGPDAGFAAALAGFAHLLRDRDMPGGWGYEDAIAMANASRGDDLFGFRAEAARLMEKAQRLAP